MNASTENEDPDLRYAEYVLGVLEADARAAVTEEIRTSPQAAAAVEGWEQRLASLVETVDEIAPPAEAWARISSTLGLQTVADAIAFSGGRPAPLARPRAPASLWESLSWWRGLALAASAAVVILLIVLMLPRRAVPPLGTYMSATIQQTNGAASWTVTVDLRAGRAILVPAMPPVLPAGRVPELWLIPPGGAPLPVGVFSGNASSTLPLDAALLRQLAHSDTLAVSIEPPGGSPTGQPTGAVIAQGMIGTIAGGRGNAT